MSPTKAVLMCSSNWVANSYTASRTPVGVMRYFRRETEITREEFLAGTRPLRDSTSRRMALLRKQLGSRDAAKRAFVEGLGRGRDDQRQVAELAWDRSAGQVVPRSSPRARVSHRSQARGGSTSSGDNDGSEGGDDDADHLGHVFRCPVCFRRVGEPHTTAYRTSPGCIHLGFVTLDQCERVALISSADGGDRGW